MGDPATEKLASLLEGVLQKLEQISLNTAAQQDRWEKLEKKVDKLTTLRPMSIGADPNLVSSQSSTNLAGSTKSKRRTATKTTLLDITALPNKADAHGNPLTSGRTSSDRTEDPLLPTPKRSSREDEPADGSLEMHVGRQQHSLRDYRCWRSDLESSPLQGCNFLKKELGDAWTIPDDGRIPISFTREVLEELGMDQMRAVVSYVSRFRDKIARSSDQRFYIIDYDGGGGHVLYRLGEQALTGNQELKPMRKTPPTVDAPWRRFILCQGLNTSQEQDVTPTARKLAGGCWDQAPFLLQHDRFNTRNYLATAMEDHGGCWRRSNRSPNIYETVWEAFHITFYEAPSVFTQKITRDLPRGLWRHGSLYGSDELDFCESALTLISVPSESHRLSEPRVNQSDKASNPQWQNSTYWTILLLAPLDFFYSACDKLPLGIDDTQAIIGEKSMVRATLCLLELVYVRLDYNWRLFRNHFDALLDEGDALLKPALHDTLLWDDETFSRSRKYAWVITCLTEFEISIADNIDQWRDFKSARIDFLLYAGALSPNGVSSVERIERYCNLLRDHHRHFSMKLTSTKALRDALFNASTVIESRASTRLGENIRLLTFVSIFFLPLAFCTSLWSINDKFSSTSLIYTSIAIGLSTYIIVFHLNSLSYQTSAAYTPIRNRVINRMKNEADEHWADKGKLFATFRPRLERQKPSEWWILLFWLQMMLCRSYYLLRPRRVVGQSGPEPTPGMRDVEHPDGSGAWLKERNQAMAVEISTTTDSSDPLRVSAKLDPETESSPKSSVVGRLLSAPKTLLRRSKAIIVEGSTPHQDV